ncbi:MAG: RNA polymerase sigma factor [Kofleriaceae bacterium]|nr:RNA polymerase sigma factor [Kofleriaceae bacterium]
MKRSTGPDLGAVAARARAGDSAARTELLRELYAVVRRHVYLTIGGGPVADDAVQETMIALYRGLDGFRGEASPKTWAITIASRTARRMRRREGRQVPTEEIDTAVFDVDQQSAGELVMLRRALGSLTEKKRDAFVLMSIFELTAEEAGKALGTFANTAASRDRHARAELQKYFDEAGSDVATNTERETA